MIKIVESNLEKLNDVLSDFLSILASNETLQERVCLATGYSPEQVRELAVEFVKFLIVKGQHQDQYILPSLSVDKMWHQFILHTELYRAFCERHFQNYIDHRPLNVSPPFTETLRLLREEFGEINETYWAESA